MSAAAPAPIGEVSAAGAVPVIECRGLKKTYRLGFLFNRKVEALSGLDLSVRKGEVFGFLGPNGAGKSTTLKILTRLILPTAGEARVLGRAPGDEQAAARLGFLPENPVFYDHLTGRELLDYYARLVRVPSAQRKQRITTLLEEVGLSRAADYQVRRYSKGMVERLGIAQALLQEPELVILDEPTSGLDPVGRREVRDIIHRLRARGCTVFFSTHIIPDVEAVCDRVGMLIGGKLTALGTVSELVGSEIASVEVVLERASEALLARFSGQLTRIERVGNQAVLSIPNESSVEPLLRAAFDEGARLVRVQRGSYSLEELFLKEMRASGDKSAPER
jgi:ABC-2 type transport system ATP-binding protein